MINVKIADPKIAAEFAKQQAEQRLMDAKRSADAFMRRVLNLPPR